MKKIIAILFSITILSCNQPATDTRAEGEKVMQLSKDWAQAADAGNVEKIVSYWADDAVLIAPGEPMLDGKKAIKEMVEASYKIPGFKIGWQPKKVEVSKSGDMAYIIEDSQVSFADSTGKTITYNNKAVSIWRKQEDGSWKNVVDITTPAPAQLP